MMLGAFPMLLSAMENQEPEKISLNKGWEFSQVGKNEWLPATVPGTVHQDLIDNDQSVLWNERRKGARGRKGGLAI